MELTPYIWSQIFAFFGTILYVTAPQFEKRPKIMITLAIANALYGVHYILLESYTGAAMDFIGSARYIVSIWSLNALWMVFFLGVKVAATALTFQGWVLSICGFLAGALAVIGTFVKSNKKMRMLLIVSTIFWLIYGILSQSIIASITSAFFIVSGLIGYYRYEIKKPQTEV